MSINRIITLMFSFDHLAVHITALKMWWWTNRLLFGVVSFHVTPPEPASWWLHISLLLNQLKDAAYLETMLFIETY